MKFNTTKITDGGFALWELLLIICIIALLAALVIPQARADVYQPNFYKSDTNSFPVVFTNGQAVVFTANNTNSELTLRQGIGLSVFATVQSTNATSGSTTVSFAVSYDGTTYATNSLIPWTFGASAVATNTYWTNWSPAFLSNVRSIQCVGITNNSAGTTNQLRAAQLVYSYSNQ